VFFRLLAHTQSFEVKTQNVNSQVHSSPSVEVKLSHDKLDSIGGFKSCDILHFCISILD